MKVGLIGNMNNNNFALMRYLRDLGVDAHLLLYANDGKERLSHFSPKADTWNFDKWHNYIHQTPVPNAPIATCGAALSCLMFLRSCCRILLGKQESIVYPVSKASLKRAYQGYDCLIASGISPATLLRIGMNIDIFYPYAPGVEFLYDPYFVSSFSEMRPLFKKFFKKIQNKQKLGVQYARHVVNPEPSITEKSLRSIDVESDPLMVPMVYNREVRPEEAPSKILAEAALQVKKSSFTVLHHARQIWKRNNRYTDDEWSYVNKNNEWLISAFAKLALNRPNAKPRLFLFEYGPDVQASKELITELSIEKSVTWLPKMERKEILWLLSKVSVCAGEFYEIEKIIWGGTGWEALATGKPLIHSFNFNEGEFENIFGYPPPPLLPAQKKDDILCHLFNLIDDPKKICSIGDASKDWFEKYNGIGLARKWLSLLKHDKNEMNPSATVEKN